MSVGMMANVVTRSFVLCGDFGGFQLPSGCSGISHQALPLPMRCQVGPTALGSITHREKLQVALDVVQRACQLCLSMRSTIKRGKRQLEKVDHTPVTVADFGIQALISLELGRLFPGIPLVSEENASHLRAEYDQKIASGGCEKVLVEDIVDVLATVAPEVGKLDCETVLDAIDRGAGAVSFPNGENPGQSSYWVLDPIDGTRGFLRGGDALYVVGLAFVDNGKPVLGIMGCPNVAFDYPSSSSAIQMASKYYETDHSKAVESGQRGLIMAASLGGCWVKPLTEAWTSSMMVKCEVARPLSVADSWFCISDHEVWSTSPLAHAIASIPVEHLKEDDVQVLPVCCGSLCKYFALALGGVSAFVIQAGRLTPLKVWDHAAGVICVTEAGGQVSDLDGTALEDLISSGKEVFTVEGGGILASDKTLHGLLLTRVQI